jgi:serine/threonine protein kinase
MKRCPTCQSTYPSDFAVCPRDASGLVEADPWSEGTLIRGKYRILKQIGFGGMAIVYKALHVRFNELRALKVMAPELAIDQSFVKRFLNEAVITRKLQHPNAVRLDDIDESEDGCPFIVMEYLEGRSLKDVIGLEAPLSVERVCCIAKQVAAALDAAHRLGMVHRDIKPANIFLLAERLSVLAERVKVLDFGIAKIRESSLDEIGMHQTAMTGTGMAIGTPAYMSPEQAMGKRGAELDGRADIYSLGVVMYEMLVGRLPLTADSGIKMLMAQINEAPPDVRTIRPDIPPSISRAVMMCLEKVRDHRPNSAQALIGGIESRSDSVSPGAMSSSTRNELSALRSRSVHGYDQSAVLNAASADSWWKRKYVRWAVLAVTSTMLVTIVYIAHRSNLGSNSRPTTSNSSNEGRAPRPVEKLPESTRAVQPSSPVTSTTMPTAGADQPKPSQNTARTQKLVRELVAEANVDYEHGSYAHAIALYEKALRLDSTNSELQRQIQRAKRAKATEESLQ